MEYINFERENKKMIKIAIDGPGGAGKSTIAKAAAKQLGFLYVDTGALYRATGLKFSRLGFDTSLDCDLEEILSKTEVNFGYIEGVQHVFLDGEDVSEDIRTPEASMMASAVSAKPAVRAYLLEMQRKIARENNVIMDGRDIGTVVLPNAQIKIFLTASAAVRAERRYKELSAKGDNVTLQEVYENVVSRDKADMTRAISPLRKADDAIVLDNSSMTVEEQMAWFDREFERVTTL